MRRIATLAVLTACSAALCGIATAALDWGLQYQRDTGPACWINPVDGGTMAWTLNEPHLQMTAGGPVLAKMLTFDPSDSLYDRTVEADRGIRAAASAEKIAVTHSTAILQEINPNAVGKPYKVIVAVPLAPGETKSPRPEWDVQRIDFPPTKVAHIRFQGSVGDLQKANESLNNYLVDVVQTPDGKNLDYGLFQVIEFYDIEKDGVSNDTVVELCIQVKEG